MGAVAAEVSTNSPQLVEAKPGEDLTPTQIVRELDRYVIAQEEAKRAVAIALRNRWRRLRVQGEMQDEITPKNILMIGPTGVGKTEISRRLAKLAGAPFVKVEASKFTEVGYVGRDVDSIIRDLAEVSHTMVREEEREKVRTKAEQMADERLLDLLLPGTSSQDQCSSPANSDSDSATSSQEVGVRTREKMGDLLKAGKLEQRTVEVETTKQVHTQMQIVGPQGFGEIEGQLKDMFATMMPKHKERKRVTVEEARKLLIQEIEDSLINLDHTAEAAVARAEQTGIVFIDEVDKICAGGGQRNGPDVSREGVQRDLLPLVEGCTVNTKYGPIRTDHILFIASGAFHISRPSDLMPEFQGRFPIRVELKSLTPDHFARILTEPRNALTKQYAALLETEGVTLQFAPEAIEEIARMTAEVNSRTENIGARRLHTLLEKVLEDLSFDAESRRKEQVVVDRAYVQQRLKDIVQDADLARFIL